MTGKIKNMWHFIIVFIIFVASCLIRPFHLAADGKFLRGEKWKRFAVSDTLADFYVAPNGNDSWSGRLAKPNVDLSDGPFATIQRAQKAVRRLKQQVYKPEKPPIDSRYMGSPYTLGEGRDILVLLRGGYYFLQEPIRFEPDDGGERVETDLPTGAFEFHKLKDYFVTWAAYPGEKPIISGAARLTGWKVDKRMWCTKWNGTPIQKVLWEDRVLTLARTPNRGFFTPAVMPVNTKMFQFRDGDVQNWSQMQDNRIHFMLRWHHGTNSIAGVDETNRVVHLAKPEKGLVEVPPRYYVENVPALLDTAGEWFFDEKKSQLLLIPPDRNVDPKSVIVTVPVLKELLTVKGCADRPVRNLRLYGLTFEATNNSGNDAIRFLYAHHCELVDSEIRHVGGYGVLVSNGCYQTQILNNVVQNAENGGILARGNPHPMDWRDVVRETIVSYNRVSGCGGVSIGAHNTLNTTISHNEISHNRGRNALSIGGWMNVEPALEGGYIVEYNHIHHVQSYADDSGAITSSGMTHRSFIRGNLIHDVMPGFFNDNVAYWFDNMSSGWTVEQNIYYNVPQGEMKLCATELSDNIYQNNFFITTPKREPEAIIDGKPNFTCSAMRIAMADNQRDNVFRTGGEIMVTAKMYNSGSSGIGDVPLYVDGKIVQKQQLAVIRHNVQDVTFCVRLYDPGQHTIAVGDADYQTITVEGDKLDFLLLNTRINRTVVPQGDTVQIETQVTNVRSRAIRPQIILAMDGEHVEKRFLKLASGEKRTIMFAFVPPVGEHIIRLNDKVPVMIRVYPHQPLQIQPGDWQTYCSGTATPCRFQIDSAQHRFQLIVHGTDFFHAEDSYGTIFLRQAIQGNFVATVKVVAFGERVTEWFRAGIFVRNDLTKSYETAPGSPGSVLMFTTPRRFGLQWDQFGDGCMHKASSQNHYSPPDVIWLKLERHGNQFTGYMSYDGTHWLFPRTTTPIPGLSDRLDIGMAAGAPNQVASMVQFEDFRIEIEVVK